MRLNYIAGRRMPSRRANAVQIAKMCEAFAAEGHEVVLYCREGDAPAETIWRRFGVAPNFAVVALRDRCRPLHKLAGAVRTARLMRAQASPALSYGRDPFWMLAAAGSGAPIVFEAHSVFPRRSLRARALAMLFAHPGFRRLVCISSGLAAAYRAQFPQLAGRDILVAPSPATPLRMAVPIRPWPGRAGALQVGFAGQPFPGKGIETLVEASRQLPDVDFHVVGAARGELGWIAGGLPANLHLHGYRPHAELGGFYARFDVAVAPYGRRVMNASGQESAAVTSPLKLPEYLAAGRPVIISDLPGVHDLLKGEPVALLVPAGDIAAFVEAVRRLQADPALRARLGADGRAHFERHLTAAARARHVLSDLADPGPTMRD